MSEVLETFVFPKRGRREKYPWGEWSDGRIWKVKQGKDFPGKPRNFAVNICYTAKRMGKSVRTSIGSDFVVFQFLDKLE